MGLGWSKALTVALLFTGQRCSGNVGRHSSLKLPPVFEMSVHINHELRAKSCEPCTDLHPLGAMCCGLCGFWVNDKWKSKNGKRNPWEGSCPEGAMHRMLSYLKGEGIDLGSFTAQHLFDTIQGRTLWLLGDSQTERWFSAVECFLSPFLVTPERSAPTNSTSANLWLVNYDDQPDRVGTPWFPPKPAVCSVYEGGTRVCTVRIHNARQLAAPVLRALQAHVPNFSRDVAVLNAGLHYAIGDNEHYIEDLTYLTEFIARNREELPVLLWKDTSPQHFQYDMGYYWWVDASRGVGSNDIPSNSCRPLTNSELHSEEMKAGGWYNRLANPHMREAQIPLLDTFKWTLPLWDLHMWHKDCTHFCHPSAYELWTYLLAEALKGMELRP